MAPNGLIPAPIPILTTGILERDESSLKMI